MRWSWLIVGSLLLNSAHAADEPGTGGALPAQITIARAAPERGSATLTIDWPGGVPAVERGSLALVLVLDAKTPPDVPLDASLLARQSADWEMGVLTNNCTWFLRTATEGDKTFHVVQLVTDDATKPGAPDFRKGGTYSINLAMVYLNRTLPRERMQIGLFENADPKKLNEASTKFKALSNVVEVSK